MKERPIIFGAESVRAILAGTKTQARRVAKRGWSAQRIWKEGDRLWVRETWIELIRVHWEDSPLPKDHLSSRYGPPRRNACAYKAETTPSSEEARADYGYRWKTPIFMPRWASRLTLEITDVREERLQSISGSDARAEGVAIPVGERGNPLLNISSKPHPDLVSKKAAEKWELDDFARHAYAIAWDSLNAKRGFPWESNPFVWVVSFRRVAP